MSTLSPAEVARLAQKFAPKPVPIRKPVAKLMTVPVPARRSRHVNLNYLRPAVVGLPPWISKKRSNPSA